MLAETNPTTGTGGMVKSMTITVLHPRDFMGGKLGDNRKLYSFIKNIERMITVV